MSVAMYGRDVAALVLHALDDLDLDAERLGLFDRDNAVFANDLHSLGDLLANAVGGLVVTCGNSADGSDLLLGGNRNGVFSNGADDSIGGLLDTCSGWRWG